VVFASRQRKALKFLVYDGQGIEKSAPRKNVRSRL